MYAAFSRDAACRVSNAASKQDLRAEDLLAALSSTVPLSVTRAEEIAGVAGVGKGSRSVGVVAGDKGGRGRSVTWERLVWGLSDAFGRVTRIEHVGCAK